MRKFLSWKIVAQSCLSLLRQVEAMIIWFMAGGELSKRR